MPNTKSKLPRVIYIMGTARSGSTILEILLAKGSNTFGAGEITNLVRDAFVKDLECSCKQPASKCKVWGEVKANIPFNDTEFNRWEGLQKRIEWHGGFLKQLFSINSKGEVDEYRKYNHMLLSSIQKVTNCTVIIDSSKFSGRALALNNFLKSDVSVICLTRSPKGIMKSFQKPNKLEQRPKSAFQTLLYYFLTTTLLRVACIMLRKDVLKIRYEDLLARPIDVLERIEKWDGIDLTTSKKIIEHNNSFNVGHIVTGNLLRKDGEVKFKSNNANEKTVGLSRLLSVGIMNVWRFIIRF